LSFSLFSLSRFEMKFYSVIGLLVISGCKKDSVGVEDIQAGEGTMILTGKGDVKMTRTTEKTVSLILDDMLDRWLGLKRSGKSPSEFASEKLSNLQSALKGRLSDGVVAQLKTDYADWVSGFEVCDGIMRKSDSEPCSSLIDEMGECTYDLLNRVTKMMPLMESKLGDLVDKLFYLHHCGGDEKFAKNKIARIGADYMELMIADGHRYRIHLLLNSYLRISLSTFTGLEVNEAKEVVEEAGNKVRDCVGDMVRFIQDGRDMIQSDFEAGKERADVISNVMVRWTPRLECDFDLGRRQDSQVMKFSGEFFDLLKEQKIEFGFIVPYI
jgi:hypothetical protein